MQMSTHPVHRYETPEEEDELLDEVLHSASKAARRLAQTQSMAVDSHSRTHRQSDNSRALQNPYPTPSPTAKDSATFGQQSTPSKLNIHKIDPAATNRHWPTPPYEEAEYHNKKTDYFARGSNNI
jgi:meiosis induction protein kinase IME2/SME1